MIWSREFWNSIDLDWLTPSKIAVLCVAVLAILALLVGEYLVEKRREKEGDE